MGAIRSGREGERAELECGGELGGRGEERRALGCAVSLFEGAIVSSGSGAPSKAAPRSWELVKPKEPATDIEMVSPPKTGVD